MNDVVRIIVDVLVSLATLIPLVYKLVEYVKKATQEKNWQALVKLVMAYIAEAENMFETGAEKKEWVMSMLRISASTVAVNFDEETLSRLIDELVGLTKKVNV